MQRAEGNRQGEAQQFAGELERVQGGAGGGCSFSMAAAGRG